VPLGIPFPLPEPDAPLQLGQPIPLHDPITLPPLAPPEPVPAPGGNGREPIPLPPIAPPEPAPEPAPEPTYPTPPKQPKQPGTTPDLIILAALMGALGLAIIADALADFFSWLVRSLMPPPVRRKMPRANPQKVAQALTNRLGDAESGFDLEMGSSFHKLGGLIARLAAALVALAETDNLLARRIARAETRQAHGEHALAHVAGRAQTADEAARDAGRRVHVEGSRAREHERDLRQRIRQLEHHQTHVLEPELEALRHRIPELQRGQTALRSDVAKHSGALSITGVVASTAIALDRLGAGWVRCEANQLLGRENCRRGPDFLRRLLADALPALAAADLCGFVDYATRLTETLQPAMMHFVDVEGALIGCHGATKPTPIRLHGYTPTPVVKPVSV
jgi:hypothetical protein